MWDQLTQVSDKRGVPLPEEII